MKPYAHDFNPPVKPPTHFEDHYGHRWPVEKGDKCPKCGAKGSTPGSTGNRVYTKFDK